MNAAAEFYSAYEAYERARADQITKPTNGPECLVKVEEALGRIIAAPAPASWMILEKAMILLSVMESGRSDRHDVRLLGSIIADLHGIDDQADR